MSEFEFVIKNFNDFVSDNKSNSDNKSSDNKKIENIYDFFEIIIDKILEKCQNNNNENKSCDNNNEKEINEYKMSTLRAQFRYFIQKYIDLINFKKKIKIKSEKQLEIFKSKTHSMQLREKTINQENVDNINEEDVNNINKLINIYNNIFFTKTTEGGKPNTKTKKKTKKKYNYKKKTKRNKRRKTYKKNKASI